MEGRKPPPKASHPFPGKVDVDSLFGPSGKALIKSFGVYCLFIGAYSGFHLFIHRNHESFLDRFKVSEEEAIRRRAIKKNTSFLRQKDYSLHYEHQQHDALLERNLVFDDGVKFRPTDSYDFGKAKVIAGAST